MNPLLLPFPPADKAAWRAQVQKDLKDASAPDSLRWSTTDGFVLEPYYTAEDLADLPQATIQAAQRQLPGWLNAPERRVTDPKNDNVQLHADLSRGADALVLILSAVQFGEVALSHLLAAIKLSETPVFFRTAGSLTDLIHSLKIIAPYQLKGGLLNDPVAERLQSGTSPDERFRQLAAVTQATADSVQFRTVCASGTVFHNAGATATQELALLLSGLVEQYDALTNAGLRVDQLIPKTVLSVSVGTSYFTEIAKLRALRVLWQRFLSAYQPGVEQPSPFIHAQTSTFYNAAVSPYTNLIRATTEAMAAVMGGCDVLTVLPHSAEADRDFSDRVARNVSVLLREESYLDKVADPSAGSYYIETLTHQLTEAAWAYFLRMEAMGGLLKAFDVGFIQAELDASYRAKADTLQNGRVMVGVNKFREEAGAGKPLSIKSVKTNTLPDRRLAEEFDQ